MVLSAAATPEGAVEVERAIERTERKLFILGGAEIVAPAALAVVALKIAVRRRGGLNYDHRREADHRIRGNAPGRMVLMMGTCSKSLLSKSFGDSLDTPI